MTPWTSAAIITNSDYHYFGMTNVTELPGVVVTSACPQRPRTWPAAIRPSSSGSDSSPASAV